MTDKTINEIARLRGLADYVEAGGPEGSPNRKRIAAMPPQQQRWAEKAREKAAALRARADHLETATQPEATIYQFHGGGDQLPKDQQRSLAEIREALDQIFERRWYARAGRDTSDPEIAAAHAKMEAKYGADLLAPDNHTDYGWGYLHGIQSALMWVLGHDFGNGDT